MPDKSPHHHTKKAAKSIKEKRAEKRTKNGTDAVPDAVAHIKKH
ncbi:hypothetical protein [Arthrobacter terrae]|nr:hypothetical protein [Arthrobacter terrae]